MGAVLHFLEGRRLRDPTEVFRRLCNSDHLHSGDKKISTKINQMCSFSRHILDELLVHKLPACGQFIQVSTSIQFRQLPEETSRSSS